MESLYLLLPLSVLLVLALIGVFAWALHAGQFDDLEREGLRVLEEDDESGDALEGDAVEGAVVPLPRSKPLDSAQDSPNSHEHNVAFKEMTRSDR
ncbi:MAG: cbb3-type cytochrome oxidase assembly protein CcoS [Burkholderiaceae bacterium]|nr:cbb3-type cytochrome oxidase assembly protein CcoS [Burkholderiaceae bacterium]